MSHDQHGRVICRNCSMPVRLAMIFTELDGSRIATYRCHPCDASIEVQLRPHVEAIAWRAARASPLKSMWDRRAARSGASRRRNLRPAV